MACSFCVGIQIRPATRTMPATPGVGAARRGAAHGSGPDGAAHGSGPDGGQGRRAERGAGPAGSARVALVVVSVAGGTYTVPDFAACALVTIDTQRDTLDGAPLEVAGTSAVLPAMRGLLEGFRRAGRPVVHVVRLYQPDGTNVDLCRRAAVRAGAPFLLSGAPGTQI